MVDFSDIAEDATWWRLKAGRGGVLERDWVDRNIVTIGWGNNAPDFPSVSPSDFVENDPSSGNQLSKFVGYHSEGISEGDVVVVYAPSKGHVSGVGKVGEIQHKPEQSFQYLSPEEEEEYKVADHYFIRPVDWFDWGTPVLLNDLPTRFQVQEEDQIPTPPTLQRFGNIDSERDRIESLRDAVKGAETIEPSKGGFGPEQEAQIQEWVTDNIRQLGGYNARREVGTQVGRIDVLADTDDGEVVIEIKRGRAGDRALGQLLGYVSRRQEEVDEGEVRGLLIAENFTKRVKIAVEKVDNVGAKKFNVETNLITVA